MKVEVGRYYSQIPTSCSSWLGHGAASQQGDSPENRLNAAPAWATRGPARRAGRWIISIWRLGVFNLHLTLVSKVTSCDYDRQQFISCQLSLVNTQWHVFNPLTHSSPLTGSLASVAADPPQDARARECVSHWFDLYFNCPRRQRREVLWANVSRFPPPPERKGNCL